MGRQAISRAEHTQARPNVGRLSRSSSAPTFIDNQPDVVALRKLSAALHDSPRMAVQRKLADTMQNSPSMTAQRKQIEGMNAGPAQRLGLPEEEELLQGKFAPVAQNHEPIQRAKKKKKQRPPSFKQRQAQSQRDKEAAAQISTIQDPDENAWAKSVAATQSVIPLGYQPRKKGVVMDEGIEANTSFAKKNINVTYNTEAASGKRNKRIGRLASTFTHELAVHGKNPPQRDVESPDEEEEHSAMYDPATRAEYRDLSLATHNSLENVEQKKAYARSWLDDMNFQISGDEDLGKGEKRARREWAKRQRARMNKQARVTIQLRRKHGASLTQAAPGHIGLADKVVQRMIRRDEAALGADIYNSGYEDGDELSLDTFLEELFNYAPALRASEESIRELVSSCATEDEPDFAFDTYASVVEWLEKQGVSAAEEKKGAEEEDSSDEEEELGSEGAGGQMVGKLFFPGQEYHQTVKPAIIRTIGAKNLSLLVYKDKMHKNFNFWFEKDGSIFADVNSDRNSKGKNTGYRWVDGKCVED
ncbi:MAG: hypothetical protein HY244_15765 [Rhizobiales bacterium]|nr:hypothetical protein [Hyphomicrobiales bacterium]